MKQIMLILTIAVGIAIFTAGMYAQFMVYKRVDRAVNERDNKVECRVPTITYISTYSDGSIYFEYTVNKIDTFYLDSASLEQFNNVINYYP